MKKLAAIIGLLSLLVAMSSHADVKQGVVAAFEACLSGNSDSTPVCVTYVNFIDNTFGDKVDPFDAEAAKVCARTAHSNNITLCLSKTVIKRFSSTELRVCEEGSNSDSIVTCLEGAGVKIDW